ncbi:asparagine-linked glycosylation protein [Ascosphaera aggregata]|nr:asparagine-linked glycosylation protein [Ascosphaera aggregata]
MLFISLITAAASVLAALCFCPKIILIVLSPVFHAAGWFLRKHTERRRQQLRRRVQLDKDLYRAENPGQNHATKASEGKPDRRQTEGVVDQEWDGIVGYFHPFCNAGGGGERVLWAAVKATQERWPRAICAIYTGDVDADKMTIINNVETRFNIKLHAPSIIFIYLNKRKYVMSNMYPYFTLLGQSIGSMILAMEAFSSLVPDIFVDTMGYSFALALSHLLFPRVPTGAYVHFPTISTDMLESLDDTTNMKGVNSGAGKGFRGAVKRFYWILFARLYSWTGGQIDVVTCNSSWTADHIRLIWTPSRSNQRYPEPDVLFPPIAVNELIQSIDITPTSERTIREPLLVYLAQFRPEKNHPLIIKAFASFLKEWKKNKPNAPQQALPRLALIGTVRHNTTDETHIYQLRLLAHDLGIKDNTVFVCDAPWPSVLDYLRRASIGVNGMWNEHFGMSVVEYQAAGLLSVTHDSGGPRKDIVVDLGDGPTGYRATTVEEFAAAYETALSLPETEKLAMRVRARQSARRFTEEEFCQKWVVKMERLVDLQRQFSS